MLNNIYGGGGTFENYSTKEQIIGTWINGKPLYQKTITGLSYTANSWNAISLSSVGVNNVDIIIAKNIGGWYAKGTANQFYISSFSKPSDNQGLTFLASNKDIRIQSHLSLTDVSFTIQYTKTTD